MGSISHLEPKSVFTYFEEICQIPHGSGNVQKISDYFVKFAKENNLEYVQDEALNVVIKKPATVGYENCPPVIIQGHMDMVAVKKPDCDIDMKLEGLKPETDGKFVWAEGTSLGGDDGIAVAYAMAILTSDKIKHPALEVIITTDEETGMDGAISLDVSDIKGRRMLNIDSEVEGDLLVSCAGGMRVTCHLPIKKERKTGLKYRLTVDGLQGGHSGVEIHKERGNANCILGRILYELENVTDVQVISVNGGLADNAIPRSAVLECMISKESKDMFLSTVIEIETALKQELLTKDKDVFVDIKALDVTEETVLDKASTLKLAYLLMGVPNGVIANSADIEDLVQTSLNLGILKMQDEEVILQFSVRSSLESEKKMLGQKLDVVTKLVGGYTVISGEYPGWAYKEDSYLREHMKKVYAEMFGKDLNIVAIHAGLECGIFAGKLNGLDCVSFGPNLYDIHTTEERMEVASVQRTWNFILKVLETMN